jgi:hypothetical protein
MAEPHSVSGAGAPYAERKWQQDDSLTIYVYIAVSLLGRVQYTFPSSKS